MPSHYKLNLPTILCALMLIALESGCARIINSSNSLIWKDNQSTAGLVVLLNGIEGTHALHQGTIAGLKAGGVKAKIEVCDWTTGMPLLFLLHLQHDRFHEAAAKELAAKLSQYMQQHPNTTISIIAHSGGTRIAAQCVELLPINTVDKVLFVSSALAPDYPIDQVSQRVRTGIWNIQSSYIDAPLLACGTFVAGTMDNQHTVSAGMVGFRRTMDSTKVIDVPYNFANAKDFNFGGHYGGLTYFAARDRLAPILNSNLQP